MNFLTVRLCQSQDHTNTYDLRYRILKNSFAPKWVERYQFSQSRGDDISTRDQFYGLNQEWTAQRTMEIINQKVDQINQLVPGLIDKKISSVEDQDTLNYLHAFFEKYHGKIDHWLTDPWWKDKPKEMRPIWSDLNNYIHRLEGYRSGGSPRPRIKICWYDTPKERTLARSDYELFEPGVRFGFMYSLYSDVGKDLKSLTYDHDDHHLDFVPPTYYSADCQLIFHSHRQEEIEKIKNDCHGFYKRNENYFKSKGFNENDHRLVIGAIPIAQLINMESEQELLGNLKNYNRIQEVYLY